MRTKTGQLAAFDKICAFGPPWQNHRRPITSQTSSLPTQSHSSTDLPDRALVEEYVSAYSDSIVRRVFPFIDPVLFEETLKTAYEPPPETLSPSGVASAKAAVLAFLSFVQIFGLDGETPLPMDAEACAAKSHWFAPQRVQELTLDSLQTTIMLVRPLIPALIVGLAKNPVSLSLVLWRSPVGSSSPVLRQPSGVYTGRSYQPGAEVCATGKECHHKL